MGRIFEVRKHTMFARWDRMAKQFARISKDINMAVKAGGAIRIPTRRCAAPCRTAAPQHAEGQGRGRDQARARQGRDAYEQIIYEGYAPHGVAVLSSKPPRTTPRAPSPRSAPSSRRAGGNLATTGSVAFQFRKMGCVSPEARRHRPRRPRALSDRPRSSKRWATA
jgi:transcriptional/translational regulatory protein YebC/TACO1